MQGSPALLYPGLCPVCGAIVLVGPELRGRMVVCEPCRETAASCA
jgi:hypothetical protein